MAVGKNVSSIVIASLSICFAQQWTPPQAGWVYVLDVGTAKGGQVLLVDPTSGRVKGTIQTGYHPNFGFCSDGARLYISDGPQSAGNLSIYDTQTGRAVRRVLLTDRAVYTVRPTLPSVACSADGKWIFIQIMKTLSPGVDRHTLLVIDSATGETVAKPLPLPHCGIAQFIAWPFGGWDAAVRCSNSVHLVKLNATGQLEKTGDVSLAWSPDTTPEGTAVSPALRITTATVTDVKNRTVAVIRGAGGIDWMRADTLALQPAVRDNWQRFFRVGGSVISPDSGFIYGGSVPIGNRTDAGGYMTSIVVLRAQDMAQTGEIDAMTPFASLAVSPDGLTLYTANTEARSITVIDTSTMRTVKTIPGIGEFPALILVQP
jgi:YVTN family beta-propeller protein